MKHITFLAISLTIPVILYGASTPDTLVKSKANKISSHFDISTQQFDAEVEKWQENISDNIIKIADDPNEIWFASDLVRACKKFNQVGLNNALKVPKLLKRAQAHYKVIEGNAQVRRSLYRAVRATLKKEEFKKRQNLWKKFRKTAATNLTPQEKAIIPDIHYPTPGSQNALKEWVAKNAELRLNDEQILQYQALQVVLHAFRQVHRNCDLETDDPNLLLHKKVTATQKK